MPEPDTEIDRQEKIILINKLREFLEGDWKLDRQIFDHRSGEIGELIGEACFSPQGETLVYREAGVLTLGDHHDRAHKGKAHQSYRYDFPACDRAAVHFTDGRFFHDLDLTTGLWACRHRCGDDDYAGQFRALDADSLRVVWQVKGPRKDFVLDGLYRRKG